MKRGFGARDRHDRAWRHLAERGDFDVALLQEAEAVPDWAKDAFPYSVWRPKYADSGRHRLWGCAVISRRVPLQPFVPDVSFPWLQVRPGATAIARASTTPTWLASVHFHHDALDPVLVDEIGHDGIEVTTRNGAVFETDVLPREMLRLFGDQPYVWGGDLNSDERMDDVPTFAGGNRRLREIWRAAGAVNLRQRCFEEPQQTYFGRRAVRSELDHVFADERTAGATVSWRVDPYPVRELRLSDHAPILVDLSGRSAPLPSR